MGDIYVYKKDNITADLKEVGCGDGDWIQVLQDRDHSWAVVNTVMNLHVLLLSSQPMNLACSTRDSRSYPLEKSWLLAKEAMVQGRSSDGQMRDR
jgi:hypothetical protein